VALCATLAEVREIAAELLADDERALEALDAAAYLPEGELAGTWGEFRFAPAC
jgi:hypothetical protein